MTVMHLHSTMLLLYLEQRVTALEQDVRFTFHYASTLSKNRDQKSIGRTKIYIPLCFYFIVWAFCSDKQRNTWFTFHYASTLSRSILSIISADTYLHSTMLLLYLVRVLRFVVLSFIYIPLCFYFIYLQAHEWRLDSGFTFHYASTLSSGDFFREIPITDLHSTMLLLYPYATAHARQPAEFTFHYASTLSYS